MTKAQSLGCVAILAASYLKHDLSEANLKAYAMMLEDLDHVATQEAIKRLICKNKWFPTISEIRGEVAEAACAELLEPEMAWGEVLKAIGRWGRTGDVEWSSPVMAAAVDAIGWRSICLSENEASTRSRFIDAYAAARRRVTDCMRLGVHQVPARRIGGPAPIAGLLRKANDEQV